MLGIKKKSIFLVACLSLFVIFQSEAQEIIDGFMKKPGEGTLAVSYSYERYDEFKFGTMKLDAPPPVGGSVTTQSLGVFADYGFSDRINVVLNMPYIRVQGSGNEEERDQNMGGFQDVSAYVKWRPFELKMESGYLTVLGVVGFSTPLSAYEADDLLSIGNGATTGLIKGLVQYKWNTGLFANIQGGYGVRNNNAPSAIVLSGKVGYAASNFYIDACVLSQFSDPDTPDIMRPDIPFYETRVNFTQFGVNGYYPLTSQFGVSLSFFQYLSARNTSLSTGYSGGVVYGF